MEGVGLFIPLDFYNFAIMKQDNPHYPQLRKHVEKVLQREMKTNRDFLFLSLHIFKVTHQTISPTTLKRFWGKIEKNETSKGIRTHTLNMLAQVCGYINFSSFCADNGGVMRTNLSVHLSGGTSFTPATWR